MNNTKLIPLSRNLFAVVDLDDYAWLSRFHWYCSTGGYAVRWLGRKSKPTEAKMHREILMANRDTLVDHINGNKLDNRKINLRSCTNGENVCNGKLRRDNKSGFKGVTWRERNKKWEVYIKANGIQKFIGNFDDPKKAARAFDKAALREHGDFAKTNEDLGLI